jgi:hypothetical protein
LRLRQVWRHGTLKTVLALVVVVTLQAAEVPADYTVIRDKGNHASLFAYTGWSVLTLGVGIGGIATTNEPFWQGVHIGHLVWGGVNTVIAAISLGTTFIPKREPSEDELQEGKNAQLAYAINAVFDVVTLFVSAGIFAALPDARWQGFASASLVQSAFLLVYDVTMSLYHQLNNERAL